MVCSPQPVRYYVRRALQCVTVFETPMDRDTYTEFRTLPINPKTVAKWRKRETVEDLKTGPREPHSTVLTEAEEAMIVAFRRHTPLPLDDCLHALQPTMPHLTRSALHRCLQRHGISRLPEVEGDKPQRRRFKRYPVGFFHIDIAEVQTTGGKLWLFVGIDHTSKFAVAQLVDKADRRTAWEFLQHMLEAVPCQVHTILTDNGIQFAERPRNRNTIHSRPMRFDVICEANGIKHRLTRPNHPWSREDKKTVRGTVFPNGGQVERMNRTIKDATVKRFHYDNHDQLRTSYSRKLVMALIGGISWRCSHAAILSREKDMPHDEVYHHAVARSIGIFV